MKREECASGICGAYARALTCRERFKVAVEHALLSLSLSLPRHGNIFSFSTTRARFPRMALHVRDAALAHVGRRTRAVGTRDTLEALGGRIHSKMRRTEGEQKGEIDR